MYEEQSWKRNLDVRFWCNLALPKGTWKREVWMFEERAGTKWSDLIRAPAQSLTEEEGTEQGEGPHWQEFVDSSSDDTRFAILVETRMC